MRKEGETGLLGLESEKKTVPEGGEEGGACHMSAMKLTTPGLCWA